MTDEEMSKRQVRCTTAGNHPDNDLTINCGRHWCGQIKNGVAFRFGESGSWVIGYEDLKAAYELATAIRAAEPEVSPFGDNDAK